MNPRGSPPVHFGTAVDGKTYENRGLADVIPFWPDPNEKQGTGKTEKEIEEKEEDGDGKRLAWPAGQLTP
jgi:hypothetical protein